MGDKDTGWGRGKKMLEEGITFDFRNVEFQKLLRDLWSCVWADHSEGRLGLGLPTGESYEQYSDKWATMGSARDWMYIEKESVLKTQGTPALGGKRDTAQIVILQRMKNDHLLSCFEVDTLKWQHPASCPSSTSFLNLPFFSVTLVPTQSFLTFMCYRQLVNHPSCRDSQWASIFHSWSEI